MSNPKPLTVAIAGFGWWGQHMAKRLKQNPKISVTAIIEPDESRLPDIKAAGLKRLASIDEALAAGDAQAIVLTTPNTLHEQQVVQIAEAGLHVFCEKPLGLTGASARRSVAACEKAGVVLGIGHERRFETAMKRVNTMVRDNSLGTVMHAEAAFSHDKLINVPSGDWRTRKDTAPAAGMTGMGIHLTDYFIALFGPVSTVQALTANRVLDWETPGGVAELVLARTGEPHKIERYDWSDTVVENLEAFADAIAKVAPYPYTHEELVHNIEVLEAITQSAENAETIHLD